MTRTVRSHLFPHGLIFLLAVGCASRPPASDQLELPRFQEFPVAPERLAAAAIAALHGSSRGLTQDVRASYPTIIVTRNQLLPLKALKSLAWRGDPGLWGVLLFANLKVQLEIRASPIQPGYSRLTIEPQYMAYISRWRDQRQWIRWSSRGILEEELFNDVAAWLQPPR